MEHARSCFIQRRTEWHSYYPRMTHSTLKLRTTDCLATNNDVIREDFRCHGNRKRSRGPWEPSLLSQRVLHGIGRRIAQRAGVMTAQAFCHLLPARSLAPRLFFFSSSRAISTSYSSNNQNYEWSVFAKSDEFRISCLHSFLSQAGND